MRNKRHVSDHSSGITSVSSEPAYSRSHRMPQWSSVYSDLPVQMPVASMYPELPEQRKQLSSKESRPHYSVLRSAVTVLSRIYFPAGNDSPDCVPFLHLSLSGFLSLRSYHAPSPSESWSSGSSYSEQASSGSPQSAAPDSHWCGRPGIRLPQAVHPAHPESSLHEYIRWTCILYEGAVRLYRSAPSCMPDHGSHRSLRTALLYNSFYKIRSSVHRSPPA